MQEVIFPERLRELAKPYFYSAEKENPTNTLIILVHGFGASPTETRPLGEFLCKKGYDIHGVQELLGYSHVSEYDRFAGSSPLLRLDIMLLLILGDYF